MGDAAGAGRVELDGGRAFLEPEDHCAAMGTLGLAREGQGSPGRGKGPPSPIRCFREVPEGVKAEAFRKRRELKKMRTGFPVLIFYRPVCRILSKPPEIAGGRAARASLPAGREDPECRHDLTIVTTVSKFRRFLQDCPFGERTRLFIIKQ